MILFCYFKDILYCLVWQEANGSLQLVAIDSQALDVTITTHFLSEIFILAWHIIEFEQTLYQIADAEELTATNTIDA